ncbi:hypothetical protein [Streptacidiphilus melanogenes]|uniref:hypothetical protein n=1 Tax=Streptacidiphilus melanogenes TaxID=411235 RepID=UPI0005AADFD0|nr:hypothetical protein [Streptacidiphilus melanogenes]
MHATTYRIPPLQRRSLLLWVIGLSVLPAVFIVANWHRAGWWGAGPFGPGILLIDLIYLNLASGKTVVDAHGIRTTRLLGRRSWSWDGIASIAVDVEKNQKGGNVSHLAVHPTVGRPRYLYAPWAHGAVPGAAFHKTANAIMTALAEHKASTMAADAPGVG